MQNLLNRVIKTSIYLLVFLVPIFFLPFSFEALEYNKQYLILFLVSLAFFAWIVRQVFYDKEIKFRWTFLDIFVLGFLLVAILSAIFSLDKDSSIFGFYGRFSNGLIGLLCLGVFYFLITNNIGKENVPGLLKTLSWSSLLVVLMSYFSIFGIWTKIGGFLSLPRLMQQITFNPINGSLEGLSIFLAVILVLMTGLTLFKIQNSKLTLWILLISSLGLLLIIDFTAAWLVILIPLILFVGFSLWKRLFREKVNWLLIPVFLIIISALAMSFYSLKTNLPKEQILNQQISWGTGFKSAINDVKSGFLGSGIGTFYHDFAKQKPVEINQTWLWQIRFDRAGNHFAEILGTMGFLSLLFYAAIIGMFLLISWITITASPLGRQFPILPVFLALVVGQFVYYQNTTLAFTFWLFLGLSVISWQGLVKEKAISLKDFPELSLVFSTLTLVLGVVILGLYFFAVKYYLADMNYTKALSLLGDERIKILEKTVKLNPFSPRYRVGLARTYLYEALLELAKPQAEQDSSKIQIMVAKAIDEARIATNLQPNQVANWETLGMIYREIRGVATGALEWGIKSFERAITFESTNPVLYTELGKLHLIAGDNQKARENFNKAIEKKSDYADAIIQTALLLEKEEILNEAIKKLEDLVRIDPFNVEAAFQLGRLYFNNNQVNEAIEQFKQVTVLVPDHSNAHYSLGVAYAAKEEKQLAIKEFEKVLELNPGNEDIIQKLKTLRSK